MNLEYREEPPKTLSEVCGKEEKAFACYIEAKDAYLKKRDEEGVKRVIESVSWQMGRVA